MTINIFSLDSLFLGDLLYKQYYNDLVDGQQELAMVCTWDQSGLPALFNGDMLSNLGQVKDFEIKGIGTDKYAENSASETIYLQSIVYK